MNLDNTNTWPPFKITMLGSLEQFLFGLMKTRCYNLYHVKHANATGGPESNNEILFIVVRRDDGRYWKNNIQNYSKKTGVFCVHYVM